MPASYRTEKGHRASRIATGFRMLIAAVAAFAVLGSSSPAVHAGQSPQAAQAGTGRAPAPPGAPIGNMNELMRAILFPNANVIFNVQLEDPNETRAPAKNDPKTFSITSWGDGLYPRWDVVSYAAVALEDSAHLLMRPGRLCQNGKPVPVAREDWAKFTTEVADTARAVYAASQAKNRDAVIELTDRLNTSCQSCHGVYRRGPDVDRCTPRP